METLLDKISVWVEIEYDKETNQYTLINNETPWVYWLWETLEDAVWEYLSWLWDLILINNSKKNDFKAFA